MGMVPTENNGVFYAEEVVAISPQQAREWFLALGQHPERYRFETHEGFSFTKGSFGKVGARFDTREAFWGVRVRLRFELTEVSETAFAFRQYTPIPGIWGKFRILQTEEGGTRIRLTIGGENWLTRACLRLPGVRTAVKRQIEGEVAHIARSMAELYTQGGHASGDH